MRQITIKVDTPSFQAEIKKSGNGKVQVIKPAELKQLPAGAYILVGNKTPDFGGGLASSGYIVQNGKVTHSVGLKASDVHQGSIRVP
jgi:hypothetical protein